MKLKSILIISLVIFSLFSFAQWSPSGGISRDQVLCIVSKGDSLLATGKGKIYFSTDHGNKWSILHNIAEGDLVVTLTVRGSEIYAGTWGGFLVSYDDGANWSRKNFNEIVRTIVAVGDTIYAGTNNGLFYSTDHCNTFNYWSFTGKSVLAMKYLNGYLFAGADHLYKCAVQDGNWELIPLNFSPVAGGVYSMEVAGDTLYVGSPGRFFASSDLGNTWYVNTDFDAYPIYSITEYNGTIYIVAYGTFKSTDHGHSWLNIGDGGNTAYVNSEIIFRGNEFGLDRSTVAEPDIWSHCDLGPSGIVISKILSKDTIAYCSVGSNTVYSNDCNMAISSNIGASWDNGLIYNVVPKSPITHDNTMYMGFMEGYIRILSLTDGSSQIKNCTGTPECFAFNGDTIFVGTTAGVFVSTDMCNSLIERNNGLGSHRITALLFSNGVLYAGTEDKGIFKSYNSGLNWTEINEGLANLGIVCLESEGSSLFVVTNLGIYTSVNGGLNWAFMPSGLATGKIYDLEADGSYLFAAADNGVVYSWDSGAHWLLWNAGLPDVSILSVHKINDFLLIGTNGESVWRSQLNEIGVPDKKPAESRKIKLFPNPASDFVKVEGLENNSQYRIYRLDGQLVSSQTLDDNIIDISMIPAGTYIIISGENYLRAGIFIKSE